MTAKRAFSSCYNSKTQNLNLKSIIIELFAKTVLVGNSNSTVELYRQHYTVIFNGHLLITQLYYFSLCLYAYVLRVSKPWERHFHFSQGCHGQTRI